MKTNKRLENKIELRTQGVRSVRECFNAASAKFAETPNAENFIALNREALRLELCFDILNDLIEERDEA